MLLLFKINFEIPGDGEFQSGQIEFYCFNQRHQGEMWAAEVYGWNIISSHFRELNSPCLRSVLCWVKFYSLWDLWASSFFSIISWIQFKTPLPTVQLQLPLSQPSLHSNVLFIPGTQGYQGFLSPKLNSNLEIFRWLSFWKSYENQEYVTCHNITLRSCCYIHHRPASLFFSRYTKISELLLWCQQGTIQQPRNRQMLYNNGSEFRVAYLGYKVSGMVRTSGHGLAECNISFNYLHPFGFHHSSLESSFLLSIAQ